MTEFKLNLINAAEICGQLINIVRSSNKAYRVTICEWRERRSLSQNAFQHLIYKEVSGYLIKHGRAQCSPEWVKSNLKNKFLGWCESEFVDIETGEVSKRQELKSTRSLDVGDSMFYTTQILDWACSIGCEIKIPDKCEYRRLMDSQTK